MIEKMTPEGALAVLMALRGEDADALDHVPRNRDLPVALVALSDLASTIDPPLIVIDRNCNLEANTDSFLSDMLPLMQMGEYALHLVRCTSCRSLISAKGIRPFGRSKEMLRQTLRSIERKSDPGKAV